MNDDPWTCPSCATTGDPAMRFCTSCGTPRPVDAAPASGEPLVPEGDGAPATAPAAPAAPRCAGCGEVLEGSAFCVHCGTPVGAASSVPTTSEAPEPSAGSAETALLAAQSAPTTTHPQVPWDEEPAPVVPETAGSVPSTRRRRSRVLVAAAGLLLLGGTGGAGYVLLAGDDGATVETASDSAAVPTESTSPTAVAATPSASPSSTPSPVETVPPGFTCWDGVDVELLEMCTKPRDTAGLGWMFPSMLDQEAECADVANPRKDGKLLVRHCEFSTPDGLVEVNYSWWRRVERMKEYYGETNPDFTVIDSFVDAGLQYYRYDLRLGEWKAALHFEDLPFSATVYARSAEALTTYLLDQPIVVARPAEEYLGLPAEPGTETAAASAAAPAGCLSQQIIDDLVPGSTLAEVEAVIGAPGETWSGDPSVAQLRWPGCGGPAAEARCLLFESPTGDGRGQVLLPGDDPCL